MRPSRGPISASNGHVIGECLAEQLHLGVRLRDSALNRTDIGQVIKEIVDDGASSDHQIPKKPNKPKEAEAKKAQGSVRA
jgi:hypothetical protein